MLHLLYGQSLFIRYNPAGESPCTLQTYTHFLQILGLHPRGKLSQSYSLKLIFCLIIISNTVVTMALWIRALILESRKEWRSIPLLLPWGVYCIHDIISLQYIILCFYSESSLSPFVLLILTMSLNAQIFHNKEYVPVPTKADSRTSACFNCVGSLFICQTLLPAFSKWLCNFLLFCCSWTMLWDMSAIMLHTGDFTVGVTTGVQYQKRCDNENLNIQ